MYPLLMDAMAGDRKAALLGSARRAATHRTRRAADHYDAAAPAKVLPLRLARPAAEPCVACPEAS